MTPEPSKRSRSAEVSSERKSARRRHHYDQDSVARFIHTQLARAFELSVGIAKLFAMMILLVVAASELRDIWNTKFGRELQKSQPCVLQLQLRELPKTPDQTVLDENHRP